MMDLSFGEQVKIILSRKGMTIKRLAEEVEKYTGKPMSRQNMTQRLGRDNFQEQDMRMIADILGCDLTLRITSKEGYEVSEKREPVQETEHIKERKREYFPVQHEEEKIVGEINPYTRKEYETNSVRIHPKKIGYVQVYDRGKHGWMEMTEWGFLGYQERLKQQMGKDYKEPIYLD